MTGIILDYILILSYSDTLQSLKPNLRNSKYHNSRHLVIQMTILM